MKNIDDILNLSRKTRFEFRINNKLKETVKTICQENNVSIGDYITMLIIKDIAPTDEKINILYSELTFEIDMKEVDRIMDSVRFFLNGTPNFVCLLKEFESRNNAIFKNPNSAYMIKKLEKFKNENISFMHCVEKGFINYTYSDYLKCLEIKKGVEIDV